MTTTPFDTHGLSPAKLALLARRLRGEGGNTGGGIPRRPEGEPVPLPPAQHSLWVVDQVLADNSVYSVHREWWLSGPLDPEALRRALDDLVRRHEILRTTYLDAGDNQPVQVIHPAGDADFRVVDLTGVPGGQRERRAVRLAEAELRRPFDLAAGPVFRAALFRVDTEEHLLLLNMHHLVSDGWSCAVLGRELGELYSAHVHGTRPALPELPIQYADYAHWQARRVTGELRDQQLGYWRSTLDDIRPLLALPTDRPYPAVPSHRAAQVKRTLPAATTSAVRALARDRGVTVFTTVLTAFAVVLGRCSGQDTFSVGSLTSGRGHVEVADLLGLFANTVPIPADLRGEPTFAELLDRTHRAVLGALDHQDVSFDQIVAAVAPNREPARNPLFQVLFQLIERGEESWRFAGLGTRYANLHNDTGKVDLALFAVDLGERLELQVEYSTDLLLTETADRFADRVVRVLDQVITNPDTHLSDVDVLPDRERAIVTVGWNDTAADYPRATLSALFEDAARRAPDSVAVTDVDGDTVSYAALNARANRLAHHLRALGTDAESVVGVCVEHSVDMFAALLGVLKAGAAYVPLDPEHPADRLAFMLSDTGARVVVTQEAAASAVPVEFDGTLVSLDGDAERLAGRPSTDPVAVTGPDNLVYVMYTSGSTGRPKGVMISHAGLVNYLWWAIGGYGLDGASGAPMLGSIAFDLSVPNFFLPLIGGKDVTLLPKDKSLSALADLVRDPGDFSLLKLTPGHLDVLRGMLSDSDRVDCVRTFVVGADEVRPETVAAWRKVAPNARIIDEYGPTETVVGCSTYLVDESFDPSVPVSIGRPIANIRMYVLDDRLEPVPVGAVGELCIGGAGVARGYLNRRGLTAEKFVPDPFAPTPGMRMYRTGDLARFRADGNLDFLGRIDHQVKILGYRVELGEIEARLLLHERVSEAVVVAREDVPGHKRLVAYVVPAGDLDVEELRSAAAKSLPVYMVPRVWQVLDRMPLTQAGKVDRKALPAPEGAAAPISSQQAPTTPAEAALAEIWARVLDVDRVGVHDDRRAGKARRAGGDRAAGVRAPDRGHAGSRDRLGDPGNGAGRPAHGVRNGGVDADPALVHRTACPPRPLQPVGAGELPVGRAPRRADTRTGRGGGPPRLVAHALVASRRSVAGRDHGGRGWPAGASGGPDRAVRRATARDQGSGRPRCPHQTVADRRTNRVGGPVHRGRPRHRAADRRPPCRRRHRVLEHPPRRPRHHMPAARCRRTGQAAGQEHLLPVLGEAPQRPRQLPRVRRRGRPLGDTGRDAGVHPDRPRPRPQLRAVRPRGGSRAARGHHRCAGATGAGRIPHGDQRCTADRAGPHDHRVDGWRRGAGGAGRPRA
jgi:amino acid adenylation domain-containing protein